MKWARSTGQELACEFAHFGFDPAGRRQLLLGIEDWDGEAMAPPSESTGRDDPMLVVEARTSRCTIVSLRDLTDGNDGMGHINSDAVLMRRAARWLSENPDHACHATQMDFDPTGHHRLLLAVDGWD